MFRAIDSIVNNIEDRENYRVIITADYDDKTMERDNIIEKCLGYNNEKITIIWGNSKNKIDAINRDVNSCAYDWDILVNVSDDQYFIEKGFDEDIRREFEAFVSTSTPQHGSGKCYFLDQFIHFPDGNRSDFSTLSIMGRDYYNRDKRIYHPGYKSICCDIDATEEAKLRGCYKFVNTQIFFHDHYQWKDGKVCYQPEKFDATYQKNETKEIHDADKAFLEERRKQNFGVI